MNMAMTAAAAVTVIRLSPTAASPIYLIRYTFVLHCYVMLYPNSPNFSITTWVMNHEIYDLIFFYHT